MQRIFGEMVETVRESGKVEEAQGQLEGVL
jgi:hypothetical protein